MCWCLGPHFTLWALVMFILSKQYFFLGVHQIETIGILVLAPHLLMKYNKTLPVGYQKSVLRLREVSVGANRDYSKLM